MKQFLLAVLTFLLCSSVHTQSIPWFFSTPIFQEWQEANKVEGLIARHPEFASFQDYNNYLPKLAYRQNTELSQVEAHYSFDEQGDVKTVTIIRKEIRLSDSNYALNEDEYNQLCGEFKELPYALPANFLKESVPVQGLEHLNVKRHKRWGSLTRNDEIISIGGSLPKFSDAYSAHYRYELVARIHFENGLFLSYETYYPGSADTGGLPYYTKVWFDEVVDSCSLLKVHAYTPGWEGDWGEKAIIKDTIVGLGYYRCLDNGLVEGEVFEDTIGTLIYGSPLIRMHETQKGRKTVFDMNIISFRHIYSIYDTYLEGLIPPSPNVSYLGWFHSGGGYFQRDDHLFASPTVKGEYQLIRKLDKNGNYKSEELFEINQGKKQLLWSGKKVEDGYAHERKKGRYASKITYFRSKEEGRFEVIQHQKVRKNLFKVDFRLVFEGGEIVTEENGSTKKVRYEVLYRE